MSHAESYVLEIRPKAAPQEPAIAYVLVHREDVQNNAPDGRLVRASIDLRCEAFAMPGQPNSYHPRGVFHFWGGYCAVANAVSLTSTSIGSSGGVFVDPEELRGHRVAGYLMNQIVLWAQQWPSANVVPVSLLPYQATPGNHERRNAFWKSFGLKFSHADIIQGHSDPILVSNLTPVMSWKRNIYKHRLIDFLACQLERQSQMESNIKQQKIINNRLRDEVKKKRTFKVWPFCL